ncbi:acetyltransferase [Novosphingobium sp. Rr 2-17]|uniref:GNAT family N-acetyltransferase n=1 Tax=Novosphingobium sp. Rr 2-17 TaxID=555793 RepID=UPI00026981C0|nr:GNAT family N-acetyltransferase [Novosphingobium sp. Rr 2-17]EIZ79968.1 acetyltransferase [Novosphingobium sp. Rr 2-17]
MIHPVTFTDYDNDPTLRSAILTLNNEHAIELSFADEARMGMLVREAFVVRRVGMVDALLLAFDQDAPYDSANFRWFCARYSNFVYVDRVVVASHARGQGLARALYEQLFASARAAGKTHIVCEVNADPPNPASEAFHRAFGFNAVGTARLEKGKTVTYLAIAL